MTRIAFFTIALLLLVPGAWADDYTFKTFDTFSDTRSTTTVIIIERPYQSDSFYSNVHLKRLGIYDYGYFPRYYPGYIYRPRCDYYRGYGYDYYRDWSYRW